MKCRALGLAGLVACGLVTLPAIGQPLPDPPPDAPAEPSQPSEPAAPSEPHADDAASDQPPTGDPSEPPAPEPDASRDPAQSPPPEPADPSAPAGPAESASPAQPAAAPAPRPPPPPASPSGRREPTQPSAEPARQRQPQSFADALVASNERLPSLWRPPPNAVHVGLVDSALAVPLESLGLLALVTYTGFSDWKWGTASFRFNSEGWFGMDTGSGGMDKVGHAYGAYMASELLYWRLRASQDDRPVVSFYPAMFGMLLYLYIELFDGYSVDHGFAYEDVITDTLGVLLSTARNTIPAIRRGFDFRLEYFPSKGFDFHPVIDYEGQKFMGVFKLAAFPALERSPARFVELMVGYYTRGFDKDLDVDFKSAHLFFGVGFSLEQLFFKPLDQVYGWPFGFMGLAANYFQLPGTYMSAESVRTAPTGQ